MKNILLQGAIFASLLFCPAVGIQGSADKVNPNSQAQTEVTTSGWRGGWGGGRGWGGGWGYGRGWGGYGWGGYGGYRPYYYSNYYRPYYYSNYPYSYYSYYPYRPYYYSYYGW